MPKLSVQLYTFHDKTQSDLEGVLKFCSEQGFDGVEFAGFAGNSKETIKEWLTKYNLVATSAHVSIPELKNNLDEILEFHSYIGNKRIIIPSCDARNESSTTEAISIIKPLLEQINQRGFELSYHNHDYELAKFNDKSIIDTISDALPELKLQVDTFWIYAGQINPSEFLMSHRDRLSDVVHIKDGLNFKTATDEQKARLTKEVCEHCVTKDVSYIPTALGLGTYPTLETIETVEKLGLEWIVL